MPSLDKRMVRPAFIKIGKQVSSSLVSQPSTQNATPQEADYQG